MSSPLFAIYKSIKKLGEDKIGFSFECEWNKEGLYAHCESSEDILAWKLSLYGKQINGNWEILRLRE